MRTRSTRQQERSDRRKIKCLALLLVCRLCRAGRFSRQQDPFTRLRIKCRALILLCRL